MKIKNSETDPEKYDVTVGLCSFIINKKTLLKWKKTLDAFFNSEKLKLCPCCGGIPDIMGYGGEMYIECTSCGLKTYEGPTNEITHDWNIRVK